MPRLVLINGAPSSGKSTLAKRYVEEHPLTLALDIDVVRAMLGRWLDHPIEAGLMARRMALEMTRVQLLAGHDVVIPQFLGRLNFVLA
jgi:predicted kinase